MLRKDANLAANAVSTHDNFEFLEDVVPKTVPYKKVRATALATQARLKGDGKGADERVEAVTAATNGSLIVNGGGGGAFTVPLRMDERQEDPNDQLQMEMRQATGRDDVGMTG